MTELSDRRPRDPDDLLETVREIDPDEAYEAYRETEEYETRNDN